MAIEWCCWYTSEPQTREQDRQLLRQHDLLKLKESLANLERTEGLEEEGTFPLSARQACRTFFSSGRYRFGLKLPCQQLLPRPHGISPAQSPVEVTRQRTRPTCFSPRPSPPEDREDRLSSSEESPIWQEPWDKRTLRRWTTADVVESLIRLEEDTATGGDRLDTAVGGDTRGRPRLEDRWCRPALEDQSSSRGRPLREDTASEAESPGISVLEDRRVGAVESPEDSSGRSESPHIVALEGRSELPESLGTQVLEDRSSCLDNPEPDKSGTQQRGDTRGPSSTSSPLPRVMTRSMAAAKSTLAPPDRLDRSTSTAAPMDRSDRETSPLSDIPEPEKEKETRSSDMLAAGGRESDPLRAWLQTTEPFYGVESRNELG